MGSNGLRWAQMGSDGLGSIGSEVTRLMWIRLSDLDASPWCHRGGMGPGGRKHFGMLGARGKYDTSIV